MESTAKDAYAAILEAFSGGGWEAMARAAANTRPECCDHAGAVVVTLALSGLPAECPHCGAPAPDGQWGIGVHGHLLHLICPRCYTAVAPIRGTS